MSSVRSQEILRSSRENLGGEARQELRDLLAGGSLEALQPTGIPQAQIDAWIVADQLRLEEVTTTTRDPLELVKNAQMLPELQDPEGRTVPAPIRIGNRPSPDLDSSYVAGQARWLLFSTTLGAGGRGAVYEGWDLKLGKPIAIKMLLPDAAQADTSGESLVSEARVTARCSHPNIVEVFDITRIDRNGKRTPALVLEKLRGSYQVLEERCGVLGKEEITQAFQGIASALDYMAGRGLFHWDLKVKNILADESGLIKLVDFGISSLALDFKAPHLDSFVVGTPTCLSPERVMGKFSLSGLESVSFEEENRLAYASELYSFASVVYEVLTGESRWRKIGDTLEQTAMRIFKNEPLDGDQVMLVIDACERLDLNVVNVLNTLKTVWETPGEKRVDCFQPLGEDRFRAAKHMVEQLLAQ